MRARVEPPAFLARNEPLREKHLLDALTTCQHGDLTSQNGHQAGLHLRHDQHPRNRSRGLARKAELSTQGLLHHLLVEVNQRVESPILSARRNPPETRQVGQYGLYLGPRHVGRVLYQ